jgi:hypothetical protein
MKMLKRRVAPRGLHLGARIHTIHPQQFIHVNRATFIPPGMHGAQDVSNKSVRDEVIAKLVANGMPQGRAYELVARAASRIPHRRRLQRYGLGGLGDVVADATTWITYGNDIVNRSKTGNVGAEAMKAAQNINTFLGNRGDELQSTSSATVDALDEMTDKLTKIASGQIKYDSVAGAFFDEFGNAVRGEVTVGAQAVLDAPKKVIQYVGDNVVKPALDIVPWYVWAAGAGAGVAAIYSQLKKK